MRGVSLSRLPPFGRRLPCLRFAALPAKHDVWPILELRQLPNCIRLRPRHAPTGKVGGVPWPSPHPWCHSGERPRRGGWDSQRAPNSPRSADRDRFPYQSVSSPHTGVYRAPARPCSVRREPSWERPQ
eukprot:scaffold1845_cov257-Pinguiococcus_pyrenoidosus.AAC.5